MKVSNYIRLLRLSLIVLLLCNCSHLSSQRFGLKTNLLYDATTTFNLGIEIGLGRKATLDVSGNYNPWEFGDNKKMKHFLVQPELRFWTCEKFNGLFWGIHGHYAGYNIGGISLLGLKDYRYEGTAIGAGLSLGKQWILNNRFSIEASVGLGFARLNHDKYPSAKCGRFIESQGKNYIGPTKANIAIIYIIK